MPGDAIRYVDPHAARGRVYRSYARAFGTSRAALWLSRNVAWKVDPWLLRVSRGRLWMALGIPVGLLETRGARTGTPRRPGVIYFHDGDRVSVVASKAGAPEHPAWFHNVVAHPDVAFNGRPFRAHLVRDEAERARLWELADRVFPPFAVYRARAANAGRTIPLLQLTPQEAERQA